MMSGGGGSCAAAIGGSFLADIGRAGQGESDWTGARGSFFFTTSLSIWLAAWLPGCLIRWLAGWRLRHASAKAFSLRVSFAPTWAGGRLRPFC
eukprot:COSAG02_NODE_3111_length_7340_cov_5.500345_4_plen_93_part_00